MKKLIADKHSILNKFKDLSREWSSSNYISLETVVEPDEVPEVLASLLPQLPNELADCIMSDLAQMQGLSEESLQLIFDNGDVGCRVAIALRNDLSDSLRQLCEVSEEEQVQAHCR